LVKEIPKIEDPWVARYDKLIETLKGIGMPDKIFVDPEWVKIRQHIKYYINGLSPDRITDIFKLFDQVHGWR